MLFLKIIRLFIITRFLHNIHQIEKVSPFELTPETTFVEVQEGNSRKLNEETCPEFRDSFWLGIEWLLRLSTAIPTIQPHTFVHFTVFVYISHSVKMPLI